MSLEFKELSEFNESSSAISEKHNKVDYNGFRIFTSVDGLKRHYHQNREGDKTT